jgi:AcrR family transcriptional regulator
VVTARSEGNDVRAKAVLVATELFAAKGFDGTSLQDIATAVGVTKPAVLHHFPSKEHVRFAVLEAILAHWQSTLPRLLVAATASHDRFDAVFGELHRFFAQDPDRARLVLREMLDRPAELRKILKGAVRPWLAAIVEYIRAGQEGGRHFAEVDAEAYVIHVLQLVIGATASMSVTGALLDDDGKARYDRELARIARASLFAPRETNGTTRETNGTKRPSAKKPESRRTKSPRSSP